MKITSYGAAEGVTGSCHLLEVGTRKILLDCGMFQGGTKSSEKNEPPFPFDPRNIDAVIISHAHLDHIGRLPVLVREGFQGRIFSNRPTYELARLSLFDSVNILDYEARRKNRHLDPGETPVQPLFTEDDVFDVLECWDSHLKYDTPQQLFRDIEICLYDAGHILGSAFILLTLSEPGEEPVKLLYSADLGNTGKPIIRDPARPPKADIVMLESTYGNREHRSFTESVKELEQAICETLEDGNVIIPTFALERAQELLYVLYLAWRDGRIPRDTQIFLDSPMAINATGIFKRHESYYDCEALRLKHEGEDPFHYKALTYTRHSRESAKLNRILSGAIILAGSGMATGGRIVDHLYHNLMRPECGVIFCGYQASGTLGRKIVDGAEKVRIHKQWVECNAKVHTINGFSAHAGQTTMTHWVAMAEPEKIYLVHGEDDVKQEFAKHLANKLPDVDTQIMPYGKPISLTKQLKVAEVL